MNASMDMIKNIVMVRDDHQSMMYPELWTSAIVEVTEKAYLETIGKQTSFRPYNHLQRTGLTTYIKHLLDGFEGAERFYDGTNPLLQQLMKDLPKRIAMAYATSSFPVPLLCATWMRDEHARWMKVDDGVNEVSGLF